MVSSTVVDLPYHRSEVEQACLRQRVLPLMQEHLSARDVDAVRISLDLVNEASIYIGVFGFRYGWVPPDSEKSITQIEYERAVERELPRFLFLMSDKHLITVSDVEKGEGWEKLLKFKETLCRDRNCAFFSSPVDLRAQVIDSLAAWRIENLLPEVPR